MFEQMASGRGEIFYYDSNGPKNNKWISTFLAELINLLYFYIKYIDRIDCSTENICHLAWIIRDSKLSRVARGECSNGTFFSSLKEDDFSHCPVTKKP